jgi:hypothetical protein
LIEVPAPAIISGTEGGDYPLGLFGVSLSLDRVLVVGAPSEDGMAYAVHPRAGRLLRTYRPDVEFPSDRFYFGTTVLTFGSWIAVTTPSSSGSVYLYDWRTGRTVQQIGNPLFDNGHYDEALAASGDLLLIGSQGTPHDGYVDVLRRPH